MMTMQLKLLEEHEAGREEEIYQSVQDGDYSASRGAEKLKISLDELHTRMNLAGYTFPSE